MSRQSPQSGGFANPEHADKAAQAHPVVLTYHEIEPERSSYLYAVSPERFEQHVRMLTAADDARPLAFTFDDGHISHYEHAAATLEKHSQRGAFFITGAWTGTRPEYMTTRHLRDLVSRGHSVQAHGWSHRMLTLCSPAQLFEELRRSQQSLEDWLGTPVRELSVPHGRWNSRVLEVCESLGFTHVYTSEPSVSAAYSSSVTLTGRLMVTRSLSAEDVKRAVARRAPDLRLRIRGALKSGIRAAIGERRYHSIWTRLADPGHTVTTDGMTPDGCSASNPPAAPLTVLHLISSGGFYGAESMVVSLAAAQQRSGIKSIIGVFENSHAPHLEIADHARRADIPVEMIRCSGQLDTRALRALSSCMYRRGVDVVHTHGSKANVYAALAGAPVPLIATYHLDWPDRGLALFLYHAIDRLILRRFTRVVAVSQRIERSLRRAGLGRERLLTIANGIDLNKFSGVRLRPSPRKTPADRKIVGLVGRLTPQKGHRFLIAAAPAILTACPDVTFHFIGHGPDEQYLRGLVTAAGLDDHFVFRGSLRDMPGVYAGLDMVVLPSINEGLPMTLIEALAAMRPVVATSVGDVPKLIRNRETGLLIDPRDPHALAQAITTLLGDADLRDRLAINGRRWVMRNFSDTAMAARYAGVYREVLKWA